MTTTKVTIEGLEFSLAPLNLKQIRELVLNVPSGAADAVRDAETAASAQFRAIQMCAASQLNAAFSAPVAQMAVTQEQVQNKMQEFTDLVQELTLASFRELQRRVLELSGLSQESSTGEAGPAVETTSAASAGKS